MCLSCSNKSQQQILILLTCDDLRTLDENTIESLLRETNKSYKSPLLRYQSKVDHGRPSLSPWKGLVVTTHDHPAPDGSGWLGGPRNYRMIRSLFEVPEDVVRYLVAN